MADSAESPRTSTVRSFLLSHAADILARWRDSARRLPDARELTPIALVDHIPDLIEELADIAADVAEPRDAYATAQQHVLQRIAEGFDVASVVRELSLLRRAIFDVWERERVDGSIAELRAVDLAIDRVIEMSVARYAEAREAQNQVLAQDSERALAKLESLLAASPVGIAFLDHELRYRRINDALAALNGRPAADHIGRTVAEMLGDAAPQAEQLLRHVLATGEPALNLEFTVMKDGAPTHELLANYFPVRAPSGAIWGVGGVILDVSEAKRAREALQIEQQRLQAIVDHAPAAIWLKDGEGRIVLANRRLAEILGHELEAIIGKSSAELQPPDIAASHEAHDRRVMAENRAIEVEERTPSRDGARTFLSVKFPIPGDRPLVGAIATEITERKLMEEELRDAVSMRDELLAVVSHDLRNPLATVQLAATLLLGQAAGEPRARRQLEMIVRSCGRMENLIDDLLDTARIRAHRFELELKREVVADVVSEAIDLQAPLVAEKGIKLVRRCELAGLDMVCDRNRIAQVFGNLIGNAVKFCSAGDRITVTGARAEGFVQLCVADTGPGIAPGALEKVFDPYWTGATNTAQSTGLGLFIVRGIVESHGGRVWAESEPGAGARFVFTLPIAG
jgi:PAS domain S-box-containing protein